MAAALTMAVFQLDLFGIVVKGTVTTCTPNGEAKDLACSYGPDGQMDAFWCDFFTTRGPGSWPQDCETAPYLDRTVQVRAVSSIMAFCTLCAAVNAFGEIVLFAYHMKRYNNSILKWALFTLQAVGIFYVRPNNFEALEVPLFFFVMELLHFGVGWSIRLNTIEPNKYTAMEHRGGYDVYWDATTTKWVVVAKPLPGVDLPTIDEIKLPSRQEMAVPGSHLYKHKGNAPPVLTFVDDDNFIIGHGALVKHGKVTYIVTAAHVHQQATSVRGSSPSVKLNWPLEDMAMPPYINTKNDYYMVAVPESTPSKLGTPVLNFAVPNTTIPISVYHAKAETGKFEWQYSVGGIEWAGVKGCHHTASTNPGFSGTPLLIKHGKGHSVVGIHLGSEPGMLPRNRFAPLGFMAWSDKKLSPPVLVSTTESNWSYADQVSQGSNDDEYDNEDKYGQFALPHERFAISNRGAYKYEDMPWLTPDAPEKHESAKSSTNESGKGSGRVTPASPRPVKSNDKVVLPKEVKIQPKVSPKKETKPLASAFPKTMPKPAPKPQAKEQAKATPKTGPKQKPLDSSTAAGGQPAMTNQNPQVQETKDMTKSQKRKQRAKTQKQKIQTPTSTCPESPDSGTHHSQKNGTSKAVQAGDTVPTSLQELNLESRIGLLEVQIGILISKLSGITVAGSSAPVNPPKKRER